MERKCTARYDHQSQLKRTATLELYDNQYLKIDIKGFGKPRNFSLDVAALSPQFEHEGKRGWAWLGLTVVFALAAVDVLFLWLIEPRWPWYWSLAAVLAGTFAATASGVMFYLSRWRRCRVFSRHAALPLLVIPYVSKDDETGLTEFLERLRMAIELAETQRRLSAEQLRSGELRTLRRLAREEVIETESYEGAKSVILGVEQAS